MATGAQLAQGVRGGEDRAKEAHIAPERVWKEVGKQSFMILSHVTPAGQPRSSGVVYRAMGHRLYVVVGSDSLKARQIAEGQRVALTIPVRRGGPLSLVVPLPPGTISFHARVSALRTGADFDITTVSKVFKLMPADERRTTVVLELEPECEFMTWGVGVSLRKLSDPVGARAHVAVG